MKIKIKLSNPQSSFKKIELGEWIDLRSETDVIIKPGDHHMIPLGIAMKLPKEFEAIMAPRSSTFKNFGIIQTNGIGIIDSSYCGNDDKWYFSGLGMASKKINAGDRICQFRIQPSQCASCWTKLKWLFTNTITFIKVDDLERTNRGGFGSTGTK